MAKAPSGAVGKQAVTETRLLGYARHKVYPQVYEWFGDETVERNLLEELEGDLERLRSDTLAAEFQHYCPVDGSTTDDYKNRLLTVGGLELLTGVRFLGGDLTRPFVDVLYTSEPTLTPERLDRVQNAVRTEYAVFKPERTRFYCPSHLPRYSAAGDKRLLAAPLEVMVSKADADPRVTLRRADSLAFYSQYTTVYDELYAERPELREVVRVESEDDMQEYLEAGHLFEIFVDDVWAGVAAVYKDVNAGVGGFCVGEVVLAGAFRGKGLGSAVQGGLARGLLEGGARPDNLLFGTIGEVNLPARRAAERAGRIDVGGHVWVPL